MNERALIPGEHDRSTLTHREPGAMGGDPYGADIPPAPPEWEDDETRRQHELEGGGAERERATPPGRDEQRNE
jgi:hypothetical protein